MFYKALVWLILASSAVMGGAYIANAQAKTVPVPDREEFMNLVATAKSLQASRPQPQHLLTETPTVTLTPTEVLTATVTVTPTEVITATATATPIATPTPPHPGRDVFCARFQERDHPLAERIAKEFGVSLDEIIRQFCVGRGFGEIELAYSIAAKQGIPVDEVFAWRDAGKGWGNIMQDFGIKGNPKNDLMDPGHGRFRRNR